MKKRNLSLTGLRHQGQSPAVDQVARQQRDIVSSIETRKKKKKFQQNVQDRLVSFVCYDGTKRAGPVREPERGQWAGPIGTSLTLADRWTVDQLPTDGPTWQAGEKVGKIFSIQKLNSKIKCN